MTLPRQLISDGFTRVERDDRLFDVFPQETRAWGVELWEKWGASEIHLVCIKNERDMKKFTLPRALIEQALLENQKLEKIEDLADEDNVSQ